ncbi:MAG: T9SS type A sorting domain-containing protein [Ignavibacteriaceae bacterium]
MVGKLFTNSNRNKRFILLFCFYQAIFIIQVYAQTITVKGTLVSSRYPVQNASVNFVDKADTTIKYSAVTDASGKYEINLSITSVNTGSVLPSKFELEQNYPNPFSTSTAIPYDLNKGSDIKVTIYDILGRVVRKFDIGQQSVGTHNITWNGNNDFAQKVASGIYFYRLDADGQSQVKKMVFNQNGKNLFVFPHSYFSKENTFSSKINKTESVQGNTFTIQVENTNTTLPVIVPDKLENVVINNDTTINFSLNYLPTAIVDFDSLHQFIRGFGAANILPWRPDMTDSEIQTAFGTGDGQLGFSILRLMIQPDSNQWSMNVPTAKKAHDMGVLIFASPWNPPSSMLETLNNQNHLRYDKYDAYASHLNSFNTFMAKNGVPLYGVSVQNEPDYGDWTRWTADEMLTFMKNNAQNIQTRVIAPESFQFKHSMSDPILNDSVACANLDIVGGHIYGGGLAAYPLAEEKGKEVWMTEHYTDSKHSANTWPLALDVGTEMQHVMEADMNAYVWWYIVRYYGPIGDGQTSTTYPNENFAQKGEVTKRGYIMSQFARFIRPGYYRVESRLYPSVSRVDITAYKDSLSSKMVIVATNTGSSDAETVIKFQNGVNITAFTPYTTSASKNCKQGSSFNVTGGNFTYILDPSSITTFVSN